MKSKGSIIFDISEAIHHGEFSAKDLVEILEFIKSKNKTKNDNLQL